MGVREYIMADNPWHSMSDDKLQQAAHRLSDYTKEGQRWILEEIKSRGKQSPMEIPNAQITDNLEILSSIILCHSGPVRIFGFLLIVFGAMVVFGSVTGILLITFDAKNLTEMGINVDYNLSRFVGPIIVAVIFISCGVPLTRRISLSAALQDLDNDKREVRLKALKSLRLCPLSSIGYIIPVLLKQMRWEDRRVAREALRTVARLTCNRPQGDPDTWDEWWESKGKAKYQRKSP
jgi:hypothetical protein